MFPVILTALFLNAQKLEQALKFIFFQYLPTVPGACLVKTI